MLPCQLDSCLLFHFNKLFITDTLKLKSLYGIKNPLGTQLSAKRREDYMHVFLTGLYILVLCYGNERTLLFYWNKLWGRHVTEESLFYLSEIHVFCRWSFDVDFSSPQSPHLISIFTCFVLLKAHSDLKITLWSEFLATLRWEEFYKNRALVCCCKVWTFFSNKNIYTVNLPN